MKFACLMSSPTQFSFVASGRRPHFGRESELNWHRKDRCLEKAQETRSHRCRTRCQIYAAFRAAAAPQAGQLCSSIMVNPNAGSGFAIADSEGIILSAWWFISAPQRRHFIFLVCIAHSKEQRCCSLITTRRFHDRSARCATSRSALSGIYQLVECTRIPAVLRLR